MKVNQNDQRERAPRKQTSAQAAAASPSTTSTVPVSRPFDDDLVDRGMRLWMKERPDIDSTGKAVVGRLIRLEEVILRSINAVLQPFGLKYEEYAVLATLRVSGPPYHLTPTRLQKTLLFTSGGLSNLLKRLERDGLVHRSTDPKDGRRVLVTLTSKGKLLADEAMPKHANAERYLLRMFDAQECADLARLLSVMMVENAPEYGSTPA